jgi:hypothetical protein
MHHDCAIGHTYDTDTQIQCIRELQAKDEEDKLDLCSSSYISSNNSKEYINKVLDISSTTSIEM